MVWARTETQHVKMVFFCISYNLKVYKLNGISTESYYILFGMEWNGMARLGSLISFKTLRGHQVSKVKAPCPFLRNKNNQEIGLHIIKKQHLYFYLSHEKKTREWSLQRDVSKVKCRFSKGNVS